MARLLLIDDDNGFTKALSALLESDGHLVVVADSVAAAQQHLKSRQFDLQLVDLALPDGSGMELLTGDGPRAIIMTGHPSVETAVRALRGNRVVDYLVKPLDRNELNNCLARVLPASSSTNADEHAPEFRRHAGGLIGESPAMKTLYTLIDKYGGSDASVLIIGESGTGKELVARALHEAGSSDRPYVAVNCGAIPAELIASELFGHEKGAFTGAIKSKRGYFERAGDGVIFLDEVTELPMDQQVALLRVLENRIVIPVGSEKEIKVSARVIAASNRKLETAVADGDFREDLYYRLMVLPIQMPPLRERGDDISLLARYFLADYARQRGTGPQQLSDEVLDQLALHQWPGNVRELKHLILRAAIVSESNECIESLPDNFNNPLRLNLKKNSIPVGMAIKDVERQMIEETMTHYKADKKQVAEALGISLKTLYNRLNEYDKAEG